MDFFLELLAKPHIKVQSLWYKVMKEMESWLIRLIIEYKAGN